MCVCFLIRSKPVFCLSFAVRKWTYMHTYLQLYPTLNSIQGLSFLSHSQLILNIMHWACNPISCFTAVMNREEHQKMKVSQWGGQTGKHGCFVEAWYIWKCNTAYTSGHHTSKRIMLSSKRCRRGQPKWPDVESLPYEDSSVDFLTWKKVLNMIEAYKIMHGMVEVK